MQALPAAAEAQVGAQQPPPSSAGGLPALAQQLQQLRQQLNGKVGCAGRIPAPSCYITVPLQEIKESAGVKDASCGPSLACTPPSKLKQEVRLQLLQSATNCRGLAS